MRVIMMMKKSVVALCVVVMAVLVAGSAAVTCDPNELSPCLPAITGGGDASQECCAKLKEQQPCFCVYIRNPIFIPYISSPNAKKIISQCGVTIPIC